MVANVAKIRELMARRNRYRHSHVLPFPVEEGIRAGRIDRSRRWLVWVFATLVFVSAGRSDDRKGDEDKAADEPVYALSDGVTPPRVLKQVNPQYSTGARGVRVKGSILIETVVSSRGTPVKTHVVRGLDKEIDAAAVDAVKQWVFAPGKKDGKPVAVSVQIEIQFHSM